MQEFLKGNFKVKKDIQEKNSSNDENSLEAKFKKQALASIGGSMVYVERTPLSWDGND